MQLVCFLPHTYASLALYSLSRRRYSPCLSRDNPVPGRLRRDLEPGIRVRGESSVASTPQLQLASLDLCGVCRSVPTLRESVEDETPRSLWRSHQSQTGPITRSSNKLPISSRLPVVWASRLTWGLPASVLVRSAAFELWARLSVLELSGAVRASGLRSVTWPEGLRQLVLNSFSEIIPIGCTFWPDSLQ